MSDTEIAVVGAGLGGLAFAAAVGARGGVRLLERGDAPRAGGSGIVLHPNALRALARIVDLEALAAQGAVVERMVFHTGGEPVVVPLDEVWGGGAPRTLAVARPRLHAALLGGLAGGLPVEGGATVAGLRRDGDVTVLALADGRELRARLVVAADGVHSTVRACHDFPPAIATGLTYARWIVPALIVARGEWHVWRRGATTFGAFPVAADRTHVFLQRPSGDAERAVAGELLAAHREMGADAVAAGAVLVHEGPAFHVERHRWRAPGTAFVGDAAHAITPTLSEGGGLAIEDGVALAEALRRHGPSDAALGVYERARADRVAWAGRMGAIQLRAVRDPDRAPSPHAARMLSAMYRPLAERALLVGGLDDGVLLN